MTIDDNPWDFASFTFETSIQENLENLSSNKKKSPLELKSPKNFIDIEHSNLIINKLVPYWLQQRGALFHSKFPFFK